MQNRQANQLMATRCGLVLMLVAGMAGVRAYGEPSDHAPNPQAIKEVESGERTTANAAWWGFDPEDATAALQAAIDSGAERVVVPNMGRDWIVEPIFLKSDQTIVFEEGVVVTAKAGSFKGVADVLFTARGKQNVTLSGYGATLRMQKADYTTDAYEPAEWRHVLGLYGCDHVLVEGLTLRDSGGDGIYIGAGTWRRPGYGPFDQSLKPYCTNVHIRDVVCDNNHRQGISVIGAENLLIEDTRLINTGGAPPEAGIDFEPNSPNSRLVNITMRNCVMANNQGSGITFHFGHLDYEKSEPVSILFDHVRTANNRSSVYFSSNLAKDKAPRGEIVFLDNNQLNWDTVRIGIPPGGDKTITLNTEENRARAQEITKNIDLRFNAPAND